MLVSRRAPLGSKSGNASDGEKGGCAYCGAARRRFGWGSSGLRLCGAFVRHQERTPAAGACSAQELIHHDVEHPFLVAHFICHGIAIDKGRSVNVKRPYSMFCEDGFHMKVCILVVAR